MTPRERVFTALEHGEPDRVPRCEIWIDALLEELGQPDLVSAHVNLGQDCIMMPTRVPEGSNAWRNGVDEWGRVWKSGMYCTGMVANQADLERYTPPVNYVNAFFDDVLLRMIGMCGFSGSSCR